MDDVSIAFYPEKIVQGEPLLIQINNNELPVKKITFEGKEVNFFEYNKKPSVLVGIDLYKKTGNYEVIT